MMVFDHIVNHVPTKNIPVLLRKTLAQAGKESGNIPQRHTAELMAELQITEAILASDSVTMGFDATIQEGYSYSN